MDTGLRPISEPGRLEKAQKKTRRVMLAEAEAERRERTEEGETREERESSIRVSIIRKQSRFER